MENIAIYYIIAVLNIQSYIKLIYLKVAFGKIVKNVWQTFVLGCWVEDFNFMKMSLFLLIKPLHLHTP